MLTPIGKTTSVEYFVGGCCKAKEQPEMSVTVTGGPPGTDKVFCCVWGYREHIWSKAPQTK